jgi:hypothetical protein
MATKKRQSKTMAVARKLAKEALARREQAAHTRSRVLAKRSPIEGTGARNAARAAPARASSAGLVIAEGDSWFDYPLHDVLKLLEDLHGYDVESVAHMGDTVEDMAYSRGQLDELSRRIEKALRSGIRPKAILISGGGNDIAGEAFAYLLNHASAAGAGLNAEIVNGVIDSRLSDAYLTILHATTLVCEGLLGEAVPIIIHGYDHAVPDGRGFMGGWSLLPGPWLEPGFRRKGYAANARAPVVVELIDRFNAMLRDVTRRPELQHVQYLDLRGTLPSGASYKDWWANELHPTRKGFEAVAKKFAAMIG